jgi:hypothetical protein
MPRGGDRWNPMTGMIAELPEARDPRGWRAVDCLAPKLLL